VRSVTPITDRTVLIIYWCRHAPDLPQDFHLTALKALAAFTLRDADGGVGFFSYGCLAIAVVMIALDQGVRRIVYKRRRVFTRPRPLAPLQDWSCRRAVMSRNAVDGGTATFALRPELGG
jgi:hypothetical protein